MQNKESAIQEIQDLPDEIAGEVLNFILFLKRKKTKESSEEAVLSETSLAKDWLREEEDEAWSDL